MPKSTRNAPSPEEIELAIHSIRKRILERPTWRPMDEETRRMALIEVGRLDESARRTVEEIEEAFPRFPLPTFDRHEIDLDYHRVRRIAENKTWTDLDGLELVAWPDYLYVMSVNQIDYYLPTFLTTYLTFWMRAPKMYAFDSFCIGLDLTFDGCVFYRQTRRQRDCTAAFLRFFARIYSWSDWTEEGQMIEALADLWVEFQDWPTR